MKKILLFAALLGASACSEVEHDKAYYLAHRAELAEMQVQCRRVATAGSPNCQQAGRAAVAIMFGTDKEKS